MVISSTSLPRPCMTCGKPLAPGGECLPCAMKQALEAATQNPEAVGDVPERKDGSGYRQIAEPVLPRDLGHYRLLRRIGSGGMGTVYEAEDTDQGRRVALKMIRAYHFSSKEEMRRFQREAEAISRLDDPHIVPFYELGEIDGHPYFAMQLISGGTLAHRLKEGPLPAEEAVRLMCQVAGAVHHAHEKGVLHRDLKPSNILIDENGQAWLSDFGMARLIHRGDASKMPTLTATGIPIGTPHYMSPEQAAGHTRQIGPASDVWALGILFYQMLTGLPPYEGESSLIVMHKVVYGPPPRYKAPTRGQLGLAALIERCLQKEPSRRLASAGVLLEELERWQRGEQMLAQPVAVLENGLLWLRERPAAAAALVALFFVLTGCMAWQIAAAPRVAAGAALSPPPELLAGTFGRALALDGDTLVTGAPQHEPSGAVVVHQRENGLWKQQALLRADTGKAGDAFGRAVALRGDTLVVGAPLADDAEVNAGAVHVFTRQEGVWSAAARLLPELPQAEAEFGRDVALHGDTLLIGAHLEDVDGQRDAGAAYVFTREETGWRQQARLISPTPTVLHFFGVSVAVERDTLLVGADGEGALEVPISYNNQPRPSLGAAYVFTRAGTAWPLQARLEPAKGSGGCFGHSVALSGDVALIGSYRDNSSANGENGKYDVAARESGAAYVFARAGSQWTQQAYLKAHNTEAGSRFGFRVALQGTQALIGAYAESSAATGIDGTAEFSAPESGAAYLFERSGSSWSQTAYLKASLTLPLDHFGVAVAVDDETLAVGACGNDRPPHGKGLVWMFERN